MARRHDDAASSAPSEVERRLAVRAKSGDRDAFGALVERWHGPLFQFLLLRAASREDAEELTQEAFLRAWQRIGRYDPRWRISTWLFTLGRRLMVSRYRKHRVPSVGDDLLEGIAGAAEPPDLLGEEEGRVNLWALAGSVLNPQQRSALWLRYAEGMRTREIGRVIGKSDAATRVLLFRARERLAQRLAPDALGGARAVDGPALGIDSPALSADALTGGS